MALTPSTMPPLGTPAPAFALNDVVTGRRVELEDFSRAKALLVMFICNHCPYVRHVKDGIAALARDYAGKGIGIVGINSNDAVKYPQDAPPAMKVEAGKNGWAFPYLFDEDQSVARAYGAACTPDFFLYDGEKKLAYRGRMDESRPESDRPVTGADLRAAIDAILRGGRPSADQKASMGCNVKWK